MVNEKLKINLLDTSVLVKLFVTEKNSDKVTKYLHEQTIWWATNACIIETLGVLKAKNNRKEISEDEYFEHVDELMAHLRNETLLVLDTNISKRSNYMRAEALSSKYKIDVIDAYQLVEMQNYIAEQGYDDDGDADIQARPVLLTADKGLCKAAKSEKLHVQMF